MRTNGARCGLAPRGPAGRCRRRCSRWPAASRAARTPRRRWRCRCGPARRARCDAGSGSPVSADSSSTASALVTIPSTGTTSPGADDHDVADGERVDRHLLEPRSPTRRCAIRGARCERGRVSSRRARPAGDGLERVAAREHDGRRRRRRGTRRARARRPSRSARSGRRRRRRAAACARPTRRAARGRRPSPPPRRRRRAPAGRPGGGARRRRSPRERPRRAGGCSRGRAPHDEHRAGRLVGHALAHAPERAHRRAGRGCRRPAGRPARHRQRARRPGSPSSTRTFVAISFTAARSKSLPPRAAIGQTSTPKRSPRRNATAAASSRLGRPVDADDDRAREVLARRTPPGHEHRAGRRVEEHGRDAAERDADRAGDLVRARPPRGSPPCARPRP